ncbi:MAG: hypothetical protein Q8P59_02010 [Dehalococcoidia bacterium]|nr:hypothetical protein [Dehalococcoidia bacterium]
MNSKRILLSGTALGLGAIIVLAGLLSQPLYPAVDNQVSSSSDVQVEQDGGLVPDFRMDPDNLYRYSIDRKRSGEVYVLVDTNFNDMAVRQRYLQANSARAEALLRQDGRPVPVTVSFARPLPVPDFEALVKATGFQADNYVLQARDLEGRLWRHGARAKPLKDGNVVDVEQTEGSFDGAVALDGNVPGTREGLGRLLEDPRICLADVVATEVAELVSKETGVSPAKIHVEVFPAYSFVMGGTQ